MNLDNDKMLLLLETLGTAHAVEFLKADQQGMSKLSNLIGSIYEELVKEGKTHLFHKVFNEVRKDS